MTILLLEILVYELSILERQRANINKYKHNKLAIVVIVKIVTIK